MATYNTPLITNQGLSLLKAEIAGNDSVTFTKIVFSSDDYSQTTDSSVQALTALSSLDLTATARSFTDVNGNLKIRGVANNQNTTAAFYIKTYGLYGKNKAGNEMLIAVSTAQNANFVPAYNGKQTNQIAYTFNIAISSTNNITLSNSTDVDVTQADLAGINSAVNSNASSLTAQQSSYASSLSSAFSSNTSSMNSAFSANSSNASSYVSSASSSLQSQVSSYAGSIASNSSAISELQTNAVQFIGNVPTAKLQDIPNDGIYNLDGGSFPDAPVTPIYGVLIQTGSGIGVKAQRIINNLGNVYYRAINGWGIKGWYQVSTEDDISSINSSLASMASQTSNISSSVSANSSAIASNANIISTVKSLASANTSTINSNATNISNLQQSVSSNSAGISSLQSSVANNSSAISSNASSLATQIGNTQSSVASNSGAISSLQSSVATNSSAISTLQSSVDNGLQYRGVYQGQYLTNTDELASLLPSMKDGYYAYMMSSSLLGMMQVQTMKDFRFIIAFDGNEISFTQSYKLRGKYYVEDWQNMASEDSVNYLQTQVTNLNNNLNSLTGQVTALQSNNPLQFMGTITGNSLTTITASGIYDLGGNTFTDWVNGSQLWGQLIVVITGGVTNLTVRNNFGNMWIQSVNSWGSSGWKQVK